MGENNKKDLKPRSREVTDGASRAPARAMLRAIGMGEEDFSKAIPDEISKLNKVKNINLVILKLETKNSLTKDLEEYLINLNKKVLIISNNQLSFKSNFIYRVENVSDNYLYYFNNDIQYGAKYIIKRLFDISLSIILIIILFPFFILICVYIWKLDSTPIFIKQVRVGYR